MVNDFESAMCSSYQRIHLPKHETKIQKQIKVIPLVIYQCCVLFYIFLDGLSSLDCYHSQLIHSEVKYITDSW
jgi:hypothetical protein